MGDSDPVTGLCFVSDLAACPHGYTAISKTQDTNEDADVRKDSFFRKKVTRYLCYSRQFNDVNPNKVLVDLAVINDNDNMPFEFNRMDTTFDTGEKTLKKKVLCCKFIPKDTTNDAIVELILLGKMKRPPTGYTLIGDLNSLALCMKMGSVPQGSQPHEPQSMPPSYMSRPPTYSMDTQSQPTGQANLPYSLPRTEINTHQGHSEVHGYDLLQRQSSTLGRAIMISPLAGIPFQLNSRFTEMQNLQTFLLPDIQCKTYQQIENEFDYSFIVEKSASLRTPPELDGE